MDLQLEVERLRRKLSPNEDPDFTANFLAVLPHVREWLRLQTTHQGKLRVNAAEVFEEAFGYRPSVVEARKMGYTLRALGWELTRWNGLTRFTMSIEEFDDVHNA